MKKIIALLVGILLVMSCSAQRYANQRTVREMDEVSYVLANYYPQLHEYYTEGVLRVNSMKEIVLEDGTVDYKINYDFIRYYYRDFNQRMEVLKETYPELYNMYVSGVIDVRSMYKYVDKNTGQIKIHVSYKSIYDYYYNYYPNIRGGAVHIYQYRPRPYPMAPRRMQPTPAPRPQPNRPHNPPRGGGGHGPRR